MPVKNEIKLESIEKEKNNIMKNIRKLNKKGQIIKKNYLIKDNSITFKYEIFPQLDFDIYFNDDSINEYIPPPDYSEEIEAINAVVISKSSLGQSMNRSLEMKNYIYLSWLEMWAFTFWYIDKKERQYRFNQMIDILTKVIHHEMNILNLLFDTLNKTSENEMILKLYHKLIDLNINPSSFIYNIISSTMDKAQMRVLKDKLRLSKIKIDDNVLKFKNCNLNVNHNFKRTFSSIEDNLSLNDRLKFYANFSCIICGEKINLLNICKNFLDVKNDILWVHCKCGEYNLPKIKVKFGDELLKNKGYKTSEVYEIVIHSPYNLKINLKNAVIKNYGTQLIVTEFKSKFMPLFWNFIWYCKILDLDYYILLPYRNKIEQIRTNKIVINPNLNRIKIIYDNKVYHSMEDRMKGINNGLKRKATYSFLNTKFQNLEQIRVESLEIHHGLKNKYKKILGNLFGSLIKKSLSTQNNNK